MTICERDIPPTPNCRPLLVYIPHPKYCASYFPIPIHKYEILNNDAK